MADPVDTPATNAPLMSPAPSGMTVLGSSGVPSTSGFTADWYEHTQSIAVTYIVNNQYDSSLSTPYNSPTVDHNFLWAKCDVKTTDMIKQGYTFSGEHLGTHKVTMMSTGLSGGLGVTGSVQTQLLGYIRKIADVDAAGNFTDPQGTCLESFETLVNKQPGVYNPALDTSANANFVLNQIMTEAGIECATFDPNIVEI